MTNLDALIVRIGNQFLDQHSLALSEDLKKEAFRSSLAELNLSLGKSYVISGLDSELISTIPDDCLAILLKGAAAHVLESLCFHKEVSFSNLPTNNLDLESWAKYLRQERDQMLDVLRLRSLSQSTGQAWGQWKLKDPVGYD